MIQPEPITIDGQSGVIVFLNEDGEPVAPSDPSAHVARAVFDNGSFATYLVSPKRTDLGGAGSGNFGHAGRPGEVGGSAPSVAGHMSAYKAKYPEVAKNYARSSGTEMGSIESHTRDVGREWATQLTPSELAGISERFGSDVSALMAAAIPLHDIGKPDALAEGNKDRQHEHTVPILRDVLKKEGFSPKEVDLATELLNHDLIGPLFRGRSSTTPEQVARVLEDKARKVGMPVKDFAKLQLAFYQADASSYPYVTQYMTKEPSGKWTFAGAKPIAPIEALTSLTFLIPAALHLGGAGSGNFGHAGRPGEVGGSAPGDGGGGHVDHAISRIKAVLPEGAVVRVMSSNPSPHLVRAAEQTATVLEEMEAHGLAMPGSVYVTGTEERNPRASISGVTINGEVIEKNRLDVRIPHNLPPNVSLDAATVISFGETTTVDGIQYDRFTARTFKDVIVHEMGHVQAGHRGGPIPGINALIPGTGKRAASGEAVRQAALKVSEYATKNTDEFLAEAFTRLYRGETLDPESQRLYDALDGPKVPR